ASPAARCSPRPSAARAAVAGSTGAAAAGRTSGWGAQAPRAMLRMPMQTPRAAAGENNEMDTTAVSGAVEKLSMQRPALYVVATPIGNLGDLSPRARAVLASVDFILCEDTRHTRVLLEHCGVATPLEALHQHNERARAA